MQSEKNSTACTSHNLQTTARPNVSVLRSWKLRGGAATPRSMTESGREGVGGRDGGRKGGEEKETRYILYDSVIAFPRTNIARRPSGRKKTSALIVALSISLPRELYLAPLSPRATPSQPLRNFSGRRQERFAKRSLPLFVQSQFYRHRDRLFLHADSPSRSPLSIARNFNRHYL